MQQLNRDQAITFAEIEAYKEMTDEQIAHFQLGQELLCVPFDIFQLAVEKALGRPVFTHEFADPDKLIGELYGDKRRPSLEEVLSSVSKEKCKVIFA